MTEQKIDTVNDPDTRAAIEAGIEAYRKAQDAIIALIRDNGGTITENQFDEAFATHKTPFLMCGLEGHTFILGSLKQGSLGKWLHLAQIMAYIGRIVISDAGNFVTYSLPPEIVK